MGFIFDRGKFSRRRSHAKITATRKFPRFQFPDKNSPVLALFVFTNLNHMKMCTCVFLVRPFWWHKNILSCYLNSEIWLSLGTLVSYKYLVVVLRFFVRLGELFWRTVIKVVSCEWYTCDTKTPICSRYRGQTVVNILWSYMTEMSSTGVRQKTNQKLTFNQKEEELLYFVM